MFLPAAGNRNGTTVNNVGSNGNYWSSTYNNENNAYNVNFNSGNLNANNANNRNNGLSVRLVRDCRHCTMVLTECLTPKRLPPTAPTLFFWTF